MESCTHWPPAGYFHVRLDRPWLIDPVRENYLVSFRFPDGRVAVDSVSYPPFGVPRDGRKRCEHFNIAAGLRPEERLLGREGEVVGRNVVVRIVYLKLPNGTFRRTVFYFPDAES